MLKVVAQFSYDDNAIRYVLPVLWMMLFRTMGQIQTWLIIGRDSQGAAAKLRTRGEACSRRGNGLNLPNSHVWGVNFKAFLIF